MVRAGYVTRYSIANIISGNLHGDKSDLPVRVEKDNNWNDHIDKGKKVLIYLIQRQMADEGLTVQRLARQSGLYVPTIQKLFEKGGNLRILTLLKIVEDGFGIPLAGFLAGQNSADLSFEEAIEQFDSLNFDIEVKEFEQDDIIEKYLNRVKTRITRAVDTLTASNLSRRKRKELIGETYFMKETLSQESDVRIKTLLRIAHVFNLGLLEFLFHEDISSLQPVNLERLPDEAVQIALNTLSENIQVEMMNTGISLHDLQVQTGVRFLNGLERVLNGEITATYYRFVQIFRALLKSDEDSADLMRRLLRGVSTVPSTQVLVRAAS